MKKLSLLCAALVLVSAITGCGSSSGGKAVVAPMSAPATMDRVEESVSGGSYGGLVEEKYTSSNMADSQIYQNPNAKVIRSAELTIQTTEFEQAIEALAQLTEEKGGYYETAQIESGGIYSQNARRSAYYVVRIPKENFTGFRDALGTVGHLLSITEDTKDVGESYYDTEARLDTLKTKRERLLDLLSKADIMEDIISLENALAEVQYEIDAHTTTLRKYDSLIDFSVLRIHLNEVIKVTQTVGEKEGFGARLAASFRNGLEDFGEGVQDLLIWIAGNILGVLMFAVIIFGSVFGWRKVIKKRRAKKENRVSDEEKQ